MSAAIMLSVVVMVGLLAGLGVVWALRAAPKKRSVRRIAVKRKTGPFRAATIAGPAAGAAAAVAAGAAAAAPERAVAASDQERIEAMRALLHRGDEKARKHASEHPEAAAFAETQAFDDDAVSSLPMNWADSKPPKKDVDDSGHISL